MNINLEANTVSLQIRGERKTAHYIRLIEIKKRALRGKQRVVLKPIIPNRLINKLATTEIWKQK